MIARNRVWGKAGSAARFPRIARALLALLVDPFTVTEAANLFGIDGPRVRKFVRFLRERDLVIKCRWRGRAHYLRADCMNTYPDVIPGEPSVEAVSGWANRESCHSTSA